MTEPIADNWWRRFFESPDSLDLSYFPHERETNLELSGLERMLHLDRRDLIADVCCGWGRHLIPLLTRGYQAVGLDISEMMLRGARERLEAVGLPPRVLQADASALPLRDGSLDVVLNLFNSFGYCLKEGQNLAVLREAARVLKPGGRFLLDTRNRQFQILYAPYRQSMSTSEGRELILRCKYDRAHRRLDSRWSLPEDPERIVHEASIRLYGLDELRALMATAGFEEIGVYGSYNCEPFEGWQRQLLFVARKA
jgi:ubiquinone/menaquinone biosynthesis C-methylase UbiE